ncbi:uncharacterized protein LOC134822671 [Bolinopsis microptera]|uniref:uncharacterized protein LOC134822671 n=1 Tax=Bolinopsis microptera TaxID=2820187 RepID=UPI00307A74A5
MAVQVKTLKEIVLAYVCRNIDILFIKELYKISRYLRENDCDDVTEYFIDNQELNEEILKETAGSSNHAIKVLRAFLKSQGLPKIVWRESDQKNDRISVGLSINDISVKVDEERKPRARYLAAKLMLRKLLSKYISDPILNKYNQHEKTYRRAPVYDSHSYLTGKSVPACTVNSVDELQGYDFTEEERWEILKNISEHRLRRSHYMLVLHPSCRELDFSFCPAAFSPTFLELIFKKAKDVETVNLDNCYKTVNSSLCVETIVKKCCNLRSLSVNNCEFVRSEKIFENLRKYKVDLEKLNISKTMKLNVSGSLQFQKYFKSQLGRRLRVLDISGLSLCVNELGYLLGSCKRLVSLNLADTRFDSRCYCTNHDPGRIEFNSTVITNLQDLNISRTSCSKQILKLLIDNNRGLASLLKASSALTNAQVIAEPINLLKLEHLRALDMSFQGSGAYEDFSLYKHDLPISLLYLNASGFCDLDMSHLSVVCPYLRSLTLNACIINTKITCRTKEDSRGKAETIPHSLQNLSYLVR